MLKNVEIENLFEEHKTIIKSVIQRNRPLLAALALEDDDVEQDLAIVMLSAIESFDPERSDSLAAHISCKLQYEILNMKRRHNPHGITGIPNGKSLDFLYMDAVRPDGIAYELPDYDDTSGLEVSELIDSLTAPETETLEMKMNGFTMRRKAHKAILNGVRGKYTALYEENEGRIAA